MTDPQNEPNPSGHPADDRTTSLSTDRPAPAAAEDSLAVRSTAHVRYPDHPSAPERMPGAFGRYQVQGVLGRGGFGTVYVGYDAELSRRVAVKVSHGNLSPEARDATVREARRLAQLRHPGIVPVYDIGVQDGHVYIVTAFIEGTNLHRWLGGHTPTPAQAAGVIAAVADALHHAHLQRIVHRDVKPGNVMMTPDGQPILLDFGIARGDYETVENGAGVSGTPGYMSPEQAQGQLHLIGPASDVFSLGVVLYRMLCGCNPYDAPSTLELVRQVIETAPVPPRRRVPEVPEALERVCMKALARRIEDRYGSAQDFAEALRDAARPRVVAPAPAAGAKEGTGTPAAREAQRRRVTLLLCGCELADAAEPLEALDPEEQHALLREFQGVCADQAARFGGTVVPSVGREVPVCFGFPVAHEDAALRAVRTGLAVLEAMPRLNQNLRGRALAAWAAAHSGLAVVGDAGGRLSLVGEAPAVAGRLVPLAQPGALLITDATEQLTHGFLETEEEGRHTLRGQPKPVGLYRVLGDAPSRSPLEARERTTGLSPLVGRDTELAVLRDRWERTADGMGQVVLLIGEAGLGKSRLVRELKGRVVQEDSAAADAVVEWRCSAYHQASSLNPAVEYFGRLLNFTPEESPHARLDRLADHLACLGLGGEEVALFAALLSVPLDGRFAPLALSPQRQKEKTLEALLAWLRARARSRPVLFIAEDLHWVDPTTLEFLDLLVAEGGDDRVLTVLTFRPEFETPWKSKAHQTQIALTRLTRRQVTDMLKKKSGLTELPPAVADAVFAKTEGVPLFVEEFAKVLAESAAAPAPEGKDTVGRLLHEIPATLQDLLLARLDRMASNREVIQVAATLGREFGYEQLRAACSLEERPLRQELDKLVRAELVYPKGRPPRCSYLFKHALIQDAAYQSMLKATRQSYHRRIAEALTGRFPEAAEGDPELVAHHYAEAGQTAESVPYWLKAGLKAQAGFANAEAIRHLSRGLELLATLPESPDRDRQELAFQVPLATVVTMARGWGAPDVESTHLRARELCRRIGAGAPLFHVTWGQWAWHVLRDELDRANELTAELWELAGRADDGYVMEACFAQCCTGLFRGEFARTIEYGRLALGLYDPERNRTHARLTGQNSACTIRAHLAWALWMAGFPDQALRVGEEAARLGRELKDPFSTAFAVYHLGCVQQHCRMGAEARRSGEAAVAIGREQGFGILVALGTLCRGSGMVLEGADVATGVELVQEGVDAFRATGAELSLSHYFAVQAEAYRASGDPGRALAAAGEGLALLERTNERFHEANLQRLRGDLLLEQSGANAAEAEHWFGRAMETARRQGALSWELRAAMSLCRLWQRQGRHADGRELVAGVYGRFTEGFHTPDLVEARELMNGPA